MVMSFWLTFFWPTLYIRTFTYTFAADISDVALTILKRKELVDDMNLRGIRVRVMVRNRGLVSKLVS